MAQAPSADCPPLLPFSGEQRWDRQRQRGEGRQREEAGREERDGQRRREGDGGSRATTHSFQDADGLLAEPDGVEHVIVEDGLEQVVLVVRLKGGLPSHHLVHQHPQGPPVHRGAILQLLQDLFGKRATSEPSNDSRLHPRLRHSAHGHNRAFTSSLLPQSGALCHIKSGSTSVPSVDTEFGRHYVTVLGTSYQLSKVNP